ncbi:MAG: hypothetical protein LJE60_01855, partial [Thiocapsa sp.]|nr:hypothetical protein [Thiocapsa sp.]
MSDRAKHWDQVYASRRPHEVSWYQARPDTSLRLIAALGVQPGDPVIDVGAGESQEDVPHGSLPMPPTHHARRRVSCRRCDRIGPNSRCRPRSCR